MELNLEFIVHFVSSMVMVKLFFIMVPRMITTTTWLQESYYRLRLQWRHLRGIEVSTKFYDGWFLAEIWYVLGYIIIVQQILTLYSLCNTLCWNTVLEQISSFHERNPNITRPKLSSAVLESPTCPVLYMIDFFLFNIVIVGVMCAIDRRFEKCRSIPLSKYFRFYANFVFALIAAYCLIKSFSQRVANCTIGQSQLELVLGLNETVYFPQFKAQRDIADWIK